MRMTPMQNDPSGWEWFVSCIKDGFGWLASFSSLLVPALAGAVVGAFKEERRKRGRRKLIWSVIMSAACGCGLPPLFGHLFSIPDPAASSLAFFLGIWGMEGIEVVHHALLHRVGVEHEHGGDTTPPPRTDDEPQAHASEGSDGQEK